MKDNSNSYKIFKIINIILMLFVVGIMLLPYLHVVAKAFNDSRDSMLGGISVIPRMPTLDNFKLIFRNSQLFQSIKVTLTVVVFATLYELFVQFLAAYSLRRKDLLGKKIILLFLMIPMFLKGGLIPTYMLYSKIGLLNNILVYLLPAAFSFYHMIIIRTYMDSTISISLEESARIDGANDWTILTRIVLPLCKPILATITLWLAVARWNDWTTTLYYVTDRKLFTLQYILMQLVKESEILSKMMESAVHTGANTAQLEKMSSITPDSLIAAQIVITTLPIILIYPFLQKYFVKGVMVGAVKE